MNMLKNVALTLSLIFTTNLIFAQQQKPGQNKAQRDARKTEMEAKRQERIERMAEELKLTPEQKSAFNKAYDDEKAARMERREANESLAQAQRDEARKRLDAQMKTILTPEQYAKWQQRGKRGDDKNKPEKGGKNAAKKGAEQKDRPK